MFFFCIGACSHLGRESGNAKPDSFVFVHIGLARSHDLLLHSDFYLQQPTSKHIHTNTHTHTLTSSRMDGGLAWFGWTMKIHRKWLSRPKKIYMVRFTQQLFSRCNRVRVWAWNLKIKMKTTIRQNNAKENWIFHSTPKQQKAKMIWFSSRWVDATQNIDSRLRTRTKMYSFTLLCSGMFGCFFGSKG